MERPARHPALRQSIVQRERDDVVAASGIENTKAWSKQRGSAGRMSDAGFGQQRLIDIENGGLRNKALLLIDDTAEVRPDACHVVLRGV